MSTEAVTHCNGRSVRRVRFLTTEEVGDIFRTKPHTVARWCREGKFTGALERPGRGWLIPESTVEEMLRPAHVGGEQG
jgi:predicted site-specific integrase-resolvase